jgi:hypothetical protein
LHHLLIVLCDDQIIMMIIDRFDTQPAGSPPPEYTSAPQLLRHAFVSAGSGAYYGI